MKKITMLSALLFLSLANAQVPKGTQFVSGQFGFSTTKDDSNNSSSDSYRFLPTYGYFFAPNWAVAVSAGYRQTTDHSTTKNANFENLNLEAKSSAFVVTPSLRKFWVLDERFSLFCQLDFPLEFGSTKQFLTLESNGVELNHTKNSFTSYGINLKPGIDYFVNRRWKIAASIGEIGYNNVHYKETKFNKSKFNFEANFSTIQFAVKYIIPAKKIN